MDLCVSLCNVKTPMSFLYLHVLQNTARSENFPGVSDIIPSFQGSSCVQLLKMCSSHILSGNLCPAECKVNTRMQEKTKKPSVKPRIFSCAKSFSTWEDGNPASQAMICCSSALGMSRCLGCHWDLPESLHDVSQCGTCIPSPLVVLLTKVGRTTADNLWCPAVVEG